MSYLLNTEEVLCPVKCIAMFSGTPARIRLRAADRRRSCTRTAPSPASLHAGRHAATNDLIGFPSRLKTVGQHTVRSARRRPAQVVHPHRPQPGIFARRTPRRDERLDRLPVATEDRRTV